MPLNSQAPPLLVTVDVAVFRLGAPGLEVLLVEREQEPCAGRVALPGGIVRPDLDSSLEGCATRTVNDKLEVCLPYLEQVVTRGNAGRDPRGWSVTTLYLALVPRAGPHPAAGARVSGLHWRRVQPAAPASGLAFDHGELLGLALERLASRAQYTSLPVHLLGPEFTLRALQEAWESVMDRRLDRRAFRRRIMEAGILEDTGRQFAEGAMRPARVYRAREGHQRHVFSHNMTGSRRVAGAGAGPEFTT